MLLKISVLLASLNIMGCSVFLPAHVNSEDKKGEQVDIIMLNYDQMKEYQTDYEAAFGAKSLIKESSLHFVTSTGGAESIPVGKVVDAAVGFVAKKLEEEAKKYEAQFGKKIAEEGFYKRVKDPQTKIISYFLNYYGFKVVRHTSKSEEPAFELVCGIYFSPGNRVFKLAPLRYCTRRAKAKVVSTSGWQNWYAKLWGFVLNTGDQLDTEIQITIEAISVDKYNQVKTESVGPPINLTFKSYDLWNCPVLRSGWVANNTQDKDAEGKLQETIIGWLPPIPISYNSEGDPTGTGTFWIDVRVTERDPSNIREYLQKAEETLREQVDSLVDFVEEKTG